MEWKSQTQLDYDWIAPQATIYDICMLYMYSCVCVCLHVSSHE